ncbi:hypothetical protein T492DRAFT_848596 [Pavlovales sp. CCMP2436]|nr:hypothetical protein T492DRAFT_848596 [Pavlovales sp. CCMP2436]
MAAIATSSSSANLNAAEAEKALSDAALGVTPSDGVFVSWELGQVCRNLIFICYYYSLGQARTLARVAFDTRNAPHRAAGAKGLGLTGAKELAAGLTDAPALSSLSLAGCGLTDVGAAALCTAAASAPEVYYYYYYY